MKTVEELHEHLSQSGTGQAKLDAIASCETAEAALKALEQFPGTHAKAVAFLGKDKARSGGGRGRTAEPQDPPADPS